MSLFSKNLRFLRKKGNHNQEEISILFNKRANTVGNWENRKSEPSLVELMKLGEFFNVSIQDLLHTDLDLKVPGQEQGRFLIKEDTRNVISYPTEEPVNSMANEGNQDTFRIIFRELKSLHEKVDLLISGMETTAQKRTSDKSYH